MAWAAGGTVPSEAEHTVVPYDGSGDEWDAFLRRTDGSTFCHLAGWREIMRDVLGARCLYLIAQAPAGEWSGVLPLVHIESRLLGRYLVSMPFLNYGGPLGSPGARARLAEYAVSEARRTGMDLLELRARDEHPSDLRRSDRKITVLLPLPADKDELWRDTFPAKLRSQVRRPMREGMETRFGHDQVSAFYQVFARNMRDLGTPVLPRGFFERIAVVFQDLVVFGVVYLGTKPVASGCGFVWNGEFEMTWASSLQEHNPQAPNMLLYWSFMERMIARGANAFNFGRCTAGSGTHRFKQQWGGEDVPLPWRQWSPRGLTATPSPDRPLYRIATAMWQHLPLPLANLAGPVLARKIP